MNPAMYKTLLGVLRATEARFFSGRKTFTLRHSWLGMSSYVRFGTLWLSWAAGTFCYR